MQRFVDAGIERAERGSCAGARAQAVRCPRREAVGPAERGARADFALVDLRATGLRVRLDTDEHAEAVSRRLATLSAELAAVRVPCEASTACS